MTLAELLQFLHVLAAFLFVAGLIGRDVVLSRVRVSTDLGTMRSLLAISEPFDRLLVAPGSMAVLVFGILTWWMQDLPFWAEGTRWVTVSLFAYASLIPLVPLVFLPRDKVFAAALDGAVRVGKVTPTLQVALNDPVVAAARWAERGVVAVVILLMVTKPF